MAAPVVKEHRHAIRVRLHDSEQISLTFNYEGQQVKGHLWDYSRYGFGVILPENTPVPPPGTAITDIVVNAHGQSRAVGKGVIARVEQAAGERFVGLHLTEEFIDLELLFRNKKLHLLADEVKNVDLLLRYPHTVGAEFKAFAGDFAFALAVYKRKMDEFDAQFRQESAPLRKYLSLSLLQGMGKELMKVMDRKLSELQSTVQSFSRAEHEKHGFYLRKTLWPLISESLFLMRTNTKPRGYIGDSEMMQMCYRNQFEGKSTFGKVLHKHPLETPAAQAVRNRRALICDELNRRIAESGLSDFRALSVACGPAWEMQDFLRKSPFKHHIDLVLLDQDEEALGEARANIGKVKTSRPFRVAYLRDSVRTLLKTGDPALNYGKFQFIYSMGLFDYLAEPVARAVLRKLFSMTADGGLILIGNYHERNPTRLYMEYIMDWVLFYRNEQSMSELTAGLPGEFEIKIGFEPEGAQMFLAIFKHSGPTGE